MRSGPSYKEERPLRLLTIFGSPHAEGNCARLLSAFREGIPGGWRETTVSAFSLAPLPCDDCRYCYHADGCSKPDLKEFYAELEEADGLLLVTPVYNRSFPAPLKALLDRTQRYWAARFIRGIRPPVDRPKQVFLLTASGAESGEEGEATRDQALLEQQLLPTLTILNARLRTAVHYTGADRGQEITPYLAAARAVAGELEQQ
ncbi:MAG: NAD(P)H-dependent oxidoreductase [Clostridiales bacterium]|nr:NAD(P)H-dependent oxidoreductase [Clostridiales bacterium]